jgi:hypothetical protein
MKTTGDTGGFYLTRFRGFKIKHILNSWSTLYGENKINQLKKSVKKLCHGAERNPKF